MTKKDAVVEVYGTLDAKQALINKAIDFKGKKYVLVSDRVGYFNDTYPNGSIETIMLSTPDAKTVVFQAIVTPDTDKMNRRFFGHSQATWGEGYINKTSALENAETSAVGRAMAFMDIGVIDSIASLDELKKTEGVAPKEVDSLRDILAAKAKPSISASELPF